VNIKVLQSPEEILEESELLLPSDCIVYKGVVFERLGFGLYDKELEFEHKYRYFVSSDDYDYLEDIELEEILEELYIDMKAEQALREMELKE